MATESTPKAVRDYMARIGARGGATPGRVPHKQRNTATHLRRAAQSRWAKYRAAKAKNSKKNASEVA